jgi:hypothetical protein
VHIKKLKVDKIAQDAEKINGNYMKITTVKLINEKDINWLNILNHFKVYQNYCGKKLCIRYGLFKSLRVFCIIDKNMFEDGKYTFRSYGRHLLTIQLAMLYEKINNIEVEVIIVSDDLAGSPYDYNGWQ